MDTPNYKAVELDVAAEMRVNKGSRRVIRPKRTHPDHLPISKNRMDTVKIQAARPKAFSLRGDGNTVDIDRTMGRLAQNTLLYKTALQLISRKFKGLKKAIKGDEP
jgi:flagellar basal-body rod protein FlgB